MNERTIADDILDAVKGEPMPAAPGYKNLKATDVEELVDRLYDLAEDGESLIDTVNRLALKAGITR